MHPDYIYRDFSFELTKDKCTNFLQSVALTKACVTCTFVISNAFPPETVNRWTMFVKIRFTSKEQQDRFDELMMQKFGKKTKEPERISGASPREFDDE